MEAAGTCRCRSPRSVSARLRHGPLLGAWFAMKPSEAQESSELGRSVRGRLHLTPRRQRLRWYHRSRATPCQHAWWGRLPPRCASPMATRSESYARRSDSKPCMTFVSRDRLPTDQSRGTERPQRRNFVSWLFQSCGLGMLADLERTQG